MRSTACRKAAKYFSFSFFMIAPTVPALGQGFHLGVKAGVPMTAYYQLGFAPSRNPGFGILYSAATRRYTAGFAAEWSVSHRIGFEVDALYKRTGYIHDETAFSPYGGMNTTYFDVKGDSWDFPILMKYRFLSSRLPFASAGLVYRYFGPVRALGVMSEVVPLPTVHAVTTPIDTAQPYEFEKRNFLGLTLGAGYEFGRGWLRFLPELRYTYWATNITTPQDALRLKPHQLEFLLGLNFYHR